MLADLKWAIVHRSHAMHSDVFLLACCDCLAVHDVTLLTIVDLTVTSGCVASSCIRGLI